MKFAYVTEQFARPLINTTEMQKTFKKSNRDKQYLKRMKKESKLKDLFMAELKGDTVPALEFTISLS